MKPPRRPGHQAPPLYRPPGARTKRERNRDADRNRGTAKERGYDADWRRLRRLHLAEPWNNVCAPCWKRGLTRPVHAVDHIVPVRVDPSRRLDPTNLQSLCEPCHNRVKQREEAAMYGRGRADRDA